jgi:hypothetical protein
MTNADPIFFVHIPKTAGTTLDYVVQNNFGRGQVFPFNQFRDIPSMMAHIRSKFDYIWGHFPYDVIARYCDRRVNCITILRDPIERFLSNFAHYKRIGEIAGIDYDSQLIEGMTLQEFVSDDLLVDNTVGKSLQTNFLSARFTVDEQGQLTMVEPADVRRAYALLDELLFVGLTERLEDSLLLLSYTFGWRPVAAAPELNVSSQRPRQHELSDEVLRRVRTLNEADLDVYEHSTQIFEERYSRMVDVLLAEHGDEVTSHTGDRPSPAMLYRLLEQRYEQRFAETHRPVESMRIDFDGPISGIGWHQAELATGSGTVRWTGPGRTATLDVPLSQTRSVRVRIWALAALTWDILESLTLRVNQRPVALERRDHPDGGVSFEGVIPQRDLATDKSFVRLALRTNQTLPIGTSDTPGAADRLVGVAIRLIEIEPA